MKLKRQLKAHLRHCIGTRQIDDLFQEDDVTLERVRIFYCISDAYAFHPWKDGLTLSERALQYNRRIFGDECDSTCELSYRFATFLNRANNYQSTSDLLRGQLDIAIRVAGPANTLTIRMMVELNRAYISLGRKQAALELAQKHMAMCEQWLDQRGLAYLDALDVLAMTYGELGRYEESINLSEKSLAKRKNISHEEDETVLHGEFDLAYVYACSGQHQTALDIFQSMLKKALGILGEDHPVTLIFMANTALEYGHIGQPEIGIPLIIEALEVGSTIDLDVNKLQGLKEILEWLEWRSANPSTAEPKSLSESQEAPHFERVGISNRKMWRLWPKSRRRRERYLSNLE